MTSICLIVHEASVNVTHMYHTNPLELGQKKSINMRKSLTKQVIKHVRNIGKVKVISRWPRVGQ